MTEISTLLKQEYSLCSVWVSEIFIGRSSIIQISMHEMVAKFGAVLIGMSKGLSIAMQIHNVYKKLYLCYVGDVLTNKTN